jgi:hypothetical protein
MPVIHSGRVRAIPRVLRIVRDWTPRSAVVAVVSVALCRRMPMVPRVPLSVGVSASAHKVRADLIVTIRWPSMV